MELQQLRYFVAVAELGNFTRAAERCLVSQPSLSQQIIKLEKELGGPLFDRSGRKVRLTDRGQRFCERANEILFAVESAEREMTEAADAGRIGVGAIPTVAPYVLPPLLKQFVRSFPKADVTVFENLTEQTIKSCLEGEIDVGLLALPVDDQQLVVEPLFTEELLLALSKKHPLAKKRKITMKDIVDVQFVLLNETHCLGEQIVSFCKQKSCLPTVSCHSAQLLTVQQLVALGHGISLVPQMAAAADKSKDLLYRSLSGDKPTRTIAMIRRKSRHQSPLVNKFVEALQAEAETWRT